mmetsp:Transcript_19378/g.54012  ORF Transcript_19378/g.54012 Transcript_19378/m.54012 type:complete len:241 (+) Transcript_19378:2459-3181(+)
MPRGSGSSAGWLTRLLLLWLLLLLLPDRLRGMLDGLRLLGPVLHGLRCRTLLLLAWLGVLLRPLRRGRRLGVLWLCGPRLGLRSRRNLRLLLLWLLFLLCGLLVELRPLLLLLLLSGQRWMGGSWWMNGLLMLMLLLMRWSTLGLRHRTGCRRSSRSRGGSSRVAAGRAACGLAHAVEILQLCHSAGFSPGSGRRSCRNGFGSRGRSGRRGCDCGCVLVVGFTRGRVVHQEAFHVVRHGG